MCLAPRTMPNPMYKAKDGVQAIWEHHKQLTVQAPCKKCSECRAKESKEWNARILEEIRYSNKVNKGWGGYFITFTYSDKAIQHFAKKFPNAKGYELDNAIARASINQFRDRCKSKLRYYPKMYLTTELSDKNTNRLHIHGFIWNLGAEHIKEFWNLGRIDIQKASFSKAKYVVKYIHKPNKTYTKYKPIRYVSRGIGINYIEKAKRMGFHTYRKGKTKQYYTTNEGARYPMPRYWREKIWNAKERLQINIDNAKRDHVFIGKEKVALSDWWTISSKRKSLLQKDERLGYEPPAPWEFEDRTEEVEYRYQQALARARLREQKENIKRMRVQKEYYYEDN